MPESFLLLSYFRHEINISPPGCIRVDASRIQKKKTPLVKARIVTMLAAVALKNTRTRLDETNEIHDDEDRNERRVYGKGRSETRTISVNLQTRAHHLPPLLSFVLRSLMTVQTCVSRRVKTCHARFAARKASFGSKKVAGF